MIETDWEWEWERERESRLKWSWVQKRKSDKSEWNRNQCQNWKPNYWIFSIESASKMIIVVVVVVVFVFWFGFRYVGTFTFVLARDILTVNLLLFLVQVHNICQSHFVYVFFRWNYGIVWWWQINHGKIWCINTLKPRVLRWIEKRNE